MLAKTRRLSNGQQQQLPLLDDKLLYSDIRKALLADLLQQSYNTKGLASQTITD